jgi:hypothetical protein
VLTRIESKQVFHFHEADFRPASLRVHPGHYLRVAVTREQPKKVTGQTTSTVSLLIIQVDTSERECQFLLLSRELPD